MRFAAAARLLALAALLATVTIVMHDRSALPCSTTLGACAKSGVQRCDRDLGPWRVARSRSSGLPAERSHSACVLGDLARAAGGDPVVALVPQPVDVSGDTLLSRRSGGAAERQRATIQLAVHSALPDHWVFAVAGRFIDAGDATGCADLDVRPPVNAGYALIGGNWLARPHGFYFERLIDACVYDGTRAACAGTPAFIAHEFAPDERFALDLGLVRDGDTWWLEATVELLEPDGRAPGRALGRMRQRVAAPCWIAPGDPARALVLVIPSPDPPATPGARVEVSDFVWRS